MTISLSGSLGIVTPAETVNGDETVTGNLNVTGNVTVTGLINANGGGLIKSGTLISTATTTFNGSVPIDGYILTAGVPTAGTIQVGQVIAATGLVAGTSILEQTGGIPGGAGTYRLSQAAAAPVNSAVTVVGVDFYGIPSTAKRVTLMFNGYSTNGTSYPLVQLGTLAGGIQNSGYTAGSDQAGSRITYPTGFSISSVSALNLLYGTMVFTNLTANTWVCSSALMLQQSGVYYSIISTGSVTLSAGALDRLRITSVATPAVDTLDGGSLNILYE